MELPPGRYRALPAPADARRVELGLSLWREAADAADPALSSQMRELAGDAVGRRLLSAIFGNSPFLTQCCVAAPATLIELTRDGPDPTVARTMHRLDRDLESAASREHVMRASRLARREIALAVAVADLAGWWPLERVTGALSALAEAVTEAALSNLLRAGVAAREIELPHPEAPGRDCGFFALGLGKLGARELNYSSDVDLILLYDSDRIRYVGRASPSQFYSRLAQELARMLAAATGDGYVFRVDLRLRPDPGSTPAAMSTLAAVTYYESAGQNWERAALIKARPVAGDQVAARAFLAELTPFLWRRNLDFAAIEDIHSIKRQIDVHRGGRKIGVAGHNVKLGRGGIREIEFFAQTQQLIWGGRMPELRAAGTCDALDALAKAGRIAPETARDLVECYRYLRRVEHRLQMIDDAQTHSLPSDPEVLRRFAIFMGEDSADAFAATLLKTLATVEGHYARLFEAAPSLAGPGNLVFTGHEDDPDTLATLRQLGFADPQAVAQIVRGWHHGRYRATRSARARELLTELVPHLLTAFGQAPGSDTAFRRFDNFLARLPAGVQLLSLLSRNPGLIQRLAEIMGASARVADQLAAQPILVEALLHEETAPSTDRAELLADLERVLGEPRDEEELHHRARRWVGDRKFQIGVALLRETIGGETAGRAYAAVAEAAIDGLLPRLEAKFAEAHGTVPGGGIAVVGLGKLGGREMSATSDLDLILIYDAPDGIEASTGPAKLPIPSYYARLSQRLITTLTAMTQDGNLYEVDMRLRPSGNAGPVASSLAAFRRYHAETAWTWERMALTRARIVAGPDALCRAIEATVRAALCAPRDPARLRGDVAEMRDKIADSHRNPSFWDVKHRRGGIVDIEFIAQYLQLREAPRRPDVLRENTATALEALRDAGALDPSAAETLIGALRLWHNVQQMLKLATLDLKIDEAGAAPAFLAAMARAAGAVDFARLKSDMEDTAARSFALYRTIVAEPAETARAAAKVGEP
jgi:[glutamine synthetase] adenylyltransferase / [glutamine synthetase]-adenylyl-L-tyrosine phosphorylase